MTDRFYYYVKKFKTDGQSTGGVTKWVEMEMMSTIVKKPLSLLSVINPIPVLQ